MSDTMELTRAVVLLLLVAVRMVDEELEQLGDDGDQEGLTSLRRELSALHVLLATRNRAGADEGNRDRVYRAARGMVAVSEGLAPRQPNSDGTAHPDTVELQARIAAVSDDELSEHGRQLTLLEARNQEL